MKKNYSLLLQKILRLLSILYLRRTQPKIVAITGSVGKTTTKEAIYLVLEKNLKGYEVRKSWANLNNEYGVPLSILGYKKNPHGFLWPFAVTSMIFKVLFSYLAIRKNRVIVLEMAADKPGDIEYLTRMCPPDVAVVTNVGYAHLQSFGSLEKIAEEKGQLVRSLKPGGWAVLNADNTWVHQMGLIDASHTIFYGIDHQAAVWARDIKIGEQTQFKIETSGKVYDCYLPFLSEPQIYALLAAIGVGQTFDLDMESIIESFKDFNSLKGRSKVIQLQNNAILIDDTYNANPASVEAGLKVLGNLYQIKGKGRKIAVLGDMLELGSVSNTAHEQIGKIAREETDVLYTVGSLSSLMGGEKHFESSVQAAEFLKGKIKESDIVLIKGSRAVKMDYIIDYLSREDK